MFRIMTYETMVNELMNHKQTCSYSKDAISYFAKMATMPDNFDTIICYIEQDKQNACLYTKKMFTCLAQKDGAKYDDATMFANMTNAIIEIFIDHIIDTNMYVNIVANTDDAADTLLLFSKSPRKQVDDIVEEEKQIVLEMVEEELVKEDKKNEDNMFIERSELILKQLKRNQRNKKIGKKYTPYISRAVDIYDQIEDYILKGRKYKKIYKLFGDPFTNVKYMDAIIISIKQIVTNCDDITDPEDEEPGTVGEKISNHINGFSLNKNIIEPISDISYVVKQHFAVSSINNINTIESYTSSFDNPFINLYVNQPLRSMRSKCVSLIN